jgi:protein-S-isoprenylcysteine O-methyltransferase Ste14
MNRFAAYAVMIAAILLGGGSLLLFGTFLILGPFSGIRFTASESQALIWDGVLSLVFFLQHSGMIRESFRVRLSSWIPRPYHAAVYAIASGVVLTGVVLLWQTSPTVLWGAHGPLRLLPRAISILAIIGFIWGVRALRVFDPFGRVSIGAHLRGRQLPPSRLILRGPYLWVRHPLYFFVLLLIWSTPDMSLDRLCFNVLWTAWIVFGSHLEERDLVAGFGDRYRRYQETVPMLLPWRGPVGHRLQD